MPKRLEDVEEYEEPEEDEEDEEEEEREPAQRTRPVKRQLPPIPKPSRTEPRQREVRKRYESFSQQQAEGIRDAETNEVLAVDIWTALADIIERLERIENAIGVMQS